jgi:protein phosphatase PTC1
MRRPSSPNASSAPITQASGAYTGGVVNRHPNSEAVHQEIDGGASTTAASTGNNTAASDQGAGGPGSGANNELIAFRVGVSEDRNTKCRRTMEDSHAFVYDFGGVKVCLLPYPDPLPSFFVFIHHSPACLACPLSGIVIDFTD